MAEASGTAVDDLSGVQAHPEDRHDGRSLRGQGFGELISADFREGHFLIGKAPGSGSLGRTAFKRCGAHEPISALSGERLQRVVSFW